MHPFVRLSAAVLFAAGASAAHSADPLMGPGVSKELATRRAQWKPPARRFERGYGWMFTRHIQQADTGCDFDYLETTFGGPTPEPAIF